MSRISAMCYSERRRVMVLVAIALLAALVVSTRQLSATRPVGAAPQQPTPGHKPAAIVSTVGGEPGPVAIQGDFAYVGVGTRVEALALAAPAAPKWIGMPVDLGALVDDLAFVGDRLYVVAGQRLHVLDVAVPSAPRPLIVPIRIWFARMLKVVGSRVYAVGAEPLYGALYVYTFDVSDAAAPRAIESDFRGQSNDRMRDAAVTTNTLFVGTYNSIESYQLGSGGQPIGTPVAEISLPTGHLAVTGSTLWATSGANLVAYDLAMAPQLAELGRLALAEGDGPVDLAISGQRLVLVTGSGTVLVVDSAQPASPRQLSRLPAPVQYSRLALSGDRIVATTAADGVASLQLGQAGEVALLARTGPMGFISEVALGPGRAYTTGSDARLTVWDRSDPAHLGLLGQSPSTGSLMDPVTVDRLVVAHTVDGALVVVDVADDARPVVRFQGRLTEAVTRLAGLPGGAVLAATRGALHWIDLADPSRPRLIGSLPIPGASWPFVAVDGGLAYIVGGTNGLTVVDLRSQRIVGLLGDPDIGTGPVGAGGDRVYLAGRQGGRLANGKVPFVARPGGPPQNSPHTAPRPLTTQPPPPGPIVVLDVSTPEAPRELDAWRPPGYPVAFDIRGDRLRLLHTYACCGPFYHRLLFLGGGVADEEIELPDEGFQIASDGPYLYVPGGRAGLVVIREPAGAPTVEPSPTSPSPTPRATATVTKTPVTPTPVISRTPTFGPSPLPTLTRRPTSDPTKPPWRTFLPWTVAPGPGAPVRPADRIACCVTYRPGSSSSRSDPAPFSVRNRALTVDATCAVKD